MNNNTQIKEVPLEAMTVEQKLEWVKAQATKSASMCEEAKQYYEDLQVHHTNIAKLMQKLVSLSKEKETPEVLEEIENVAYTVSEVIEAINDMKESKSSLSDDSLEIEQYEEEFLDSDEGKKGSELYNQNKDTFLKKYIELKEKLGLKTQQEVADLTGIDRRQISRLEAGNHRPQFKTLQKLASGFGIKVADFFP